MTDIQKLKALAEAQPIKHWKRTPGRKPDMPGSRLIYGVEGPECVSDYEHWGFTGKAAEFIAAANPAAVLELIKDVERNQRMLVAACTDLGAISEALAADMDDDGDALLGMVNELKAENAALRNAVRFSIDQFNTQSSADGSGHADIAKAVLRIAGAALTQEPKP